MTDAPELKPCPWCGQSPKEIIDATRFLGVHRIVHRGCVLPNFSIEAATPEAVAALWNTRADLAPTDAQVRGALRDLLDAFDEHVAIPDRNCSCHLAPPCEDCVTWSFARDAVETARALRDLMT